MTNLLKATTVAALLASIAVFGVPITAHSQTTQHGKRFTGEQIYRGVLFGEAPVAQLLPELWPTGHGPTVSTKEQVVAWNKFKKDVVAQVMIIDPSFMDYFAQETQSGDHLRVQSALERGSRNTFTAMQNLGYVDSSGKPTGNLQGASLYFDVVVAIESIVAAVVVAVVIAFGVLSVQSAEQSTALYRETVVSSIAVNLNTIQ